MEKLVKSFGSGKIYKYGGKSAVSLSIVDFSDITNIIIPFFNQNPIIGIKLYDYLIDVKFIVWWLIVLILRLKV